MGTVGGVAHYKKLLMDHRGHNIMRPFKSIKKEQELCKHSHPASNAPYFIRCQRAISLEYAGQKL